MTRFSLFIITRYEIFLKKLNICNIFNNHKGNKTYFFNLLNYDTKKNQNRTIKDGFTNKL